MQEGDTEPRPSADGAVAWVTVPAHIPHMSRQNFILVQPAGPFRDALTESLPPEVWVLDSAEAFAALPPPDAGVLLLGADVAGTDVLEVVRRWALPEGDWLVVLATPGDDGPELRPLSLSFPARAEDLLSRARGETPEQAILDLEALLDAFSRARHDLNNPLTSALAEVQLLLLDVEEPEVREGLETVQRQLGRIRDLIRDLDRFRAPPAPEGSRP